MGALGAATIKGPVVYRCGGRTAGDSRQWFHDEEAHLKWCAPGDRDGVDNTLGM